jgi:hypothetical protein
MAPRTQHKVTDGDEILRNMKQQQRDLEREKLDELNAKRKELLENNPAYQEKLKALRGLIREGAQKVDLSFPSYWKAEVLTGFRAVLLKRDDRDVKPDGKVFIRYHWRNTGPAPLDCRKGKVSDGVIESIPIGGIFTTSHFAGLPLHKWYGFEVTVLCLDKRKLPGNEESEWVERDMWDFEGHLMPEDIARIESKDQDDMLFVIEAQRMADRSAVMEMARLNSAERIGMADRLQHQAEERAKRAA